ncbi:MAG: hypothetical protein ACLPTZ_28615 [Beijerinckiaceae bacterium]
MQVQCVAPEPLAAEGVVTKYFSALVEHRLGMACDLGIETGTTRRGGRDHDR